MSTHLIVAALHDEVSVFARYIADGNSAKKPTRILRPASLLDESEGLPSSDNRLRNHVKLLVTGVGADKAHAKVKKAIAESRPDSITSIGFSGITTDAVEPGTLFLPEEIVSLEGPPTEWAPESMLGPISVDRKLHGEAVKAAESQGVKHSLGRLITLPIIARTANLKQWLGKRFGVSQADMETYAVAHLAKEERIPFLSVRVGLDKACFEMPEILPRLGDTNTGNWDRILTIAEYLTKCPTDITKFITLGIGSHKARQTLSLFCKGYFTELTDTDLTDRGAIRTVPELGKREKSQPARA